MATSGSRDFTLDVSELIEEAYERCGMIVRTGYDAKTARRSLNLLFADWANRGINHWTVAVDTQALTQGTAVYTQSASVIDVLEVNLFRDNTAIQMTRLSRAEYMAIPDKTTQGRPSSYYFDKQIQPQFEVWPVPENSTDRIDFTFLNRIQDADASVNDVDAPFRFLPCMAAGLAYYIAIKKAPDRVQMLKTIYEEEFQRASDEDQDRVPVTLTPSLRYLRVN